MGDGFYSQQGRRLSRSRPGEVFSFELQGLKELDSMLKQLPLAMSKNIMRATLKKAAVPIKEAAERNAPLGPTGNLKGSIAIGTKLKKGQRGVMRKGEVQVWVGSTAPHAHLVEWGTVPRQHKDGRYTGQMPANPFFRTAWDETKDDAYKVLQIEVWNQLEKAVKRLRKKAEKGTLGKGAVRALLQ